MSHNRHDPIPFREPGSPGSRQASAHPVHAGAQAVSNQSFNVAHSSHHHLVAIEQPSFSQARICFGGGNGKVSNTWRMPTLPISWPWLDITIRLGPRGRATSQRIRSRSGAMPAPRSPELPNRPLCGPEDASRPNPDKSHLEAALHLTTLNTSPLLRFLTRETWPPSQKYEKCPPCAGMPATSGQKSATAKPSGYLTLW